MTRLEWIRTMEPGEMADFLLRVSDFEPRGIDFCQNRLECQEAIDTVASGENEPELPCRECMVDWLLSETDEIQILN